MTAVQRVNEFPNECCWKLFCSACQEELSLQLSIVKKPCGVSEALRSRTQAAAQGNGRSGTRYSASFSGVGTGD